MPTQRTPKTNAAPPVVGQPVQIFDSHNGGRPLAGVVTQVDTETNPDAPLVNLTAFLPAGMLTWYSAVGFDLILSGENVGTWAPLPL